MTEQDPRLLARRDALTAALAAARVAGPVNAEQQAAIITAPGFRAMDLSTLPEALAESRRERISQMSEALEAYEMTEAGVDDVVTWLTTTREDLVHPMTGETLAPLDWINRGAGALPAHP